MCPRCSASFRTSGECIQVHARGGTVWLHAEPYMWERRSAKQSGQSDGAAAAEHLAPNAVKVSVSDTGPGIPAEYHMEVFDDFFRLPQK